MNRRDFTKTLGCTGLALASSALAAQSLRAETTPKAVSHSTPSRPQNIVVHLSNSEGENALHSAFMGIGLATSLRQMGADVTLMLDASGPNLAKSAWSGKSLAPAAPSPMSTVPPMRLGDALAQFVHAGGSIRLCPHCSAMCGVTSGGTVPGAHLAAEGELARIVFAADKIIDY